jgi:hypothetical protein
MTAGIQLCKTSSRVAYKGQSISCRVVKITAYCALVINCTPGKINKNHNVNDVVHQLTTKENSEHISHDNYLGKVCDGLGINKSTLMFPPTNMAKTLLTVEAFYLS